MSKIVIGVEKPPKGKPRGKVFSKDYNPKPFVKGAPSANPGGRPKGSGSKLISTAYEATLNSEAPPEALRAVGLVPDPDKIITWADCVAAQMARRTIGIVQGEGVCLEAARELREVTEGKLPDKIETTGKNGAPLNTTPPTISVNFVKPGDAKK